MILDVRNNWCPIYPAMLLISNVGNHLSFINTIKHKINFLKKQNKEKYTLIKRHNKLRNHK